MRLDNDGTGEADAAAIEEWRAGMTALSKNHRVYVKLSSIVCILPKYLRQICIYIYVNIYMYFCELNRNVQIGIYIYLYISVCYIEMHRWESSPQKQALAKSLVIKYTHKEGHLTVAL